MAAPTRPFLMVSGGGNTSAPYPPADTTFTKIFVGGLAWETQRETLRRYFEQFGEILEAVVITDKHTDRSKGYGFVFPNTPRWELEASTHSVFIPDRHFFLYQVTFKDPNAAFRACLDPSPVIDGRRANCNLASVGASRRPRLATNQFVTGRFWPPVGQAMASSAFRGSSLASLPTAPAYFHQPSHYGFPYSLYGYTGGYSQDSLYPMSYYGFEGGQHNFSSYYPATSPGVLPASFYPYYTQYSHSSETQGSFALHYPQMLQYPYSPPELGSVPAILSLPTTITATSTGVASSSSQPPGNTQEPRPSA